MRNQNSPFFFVPPVETLTPCLGSYQRDQLPQANAPGALWNRQLQRKAVWKQGQKCIT
jgi:hypothetical protein